MYLCLYSCGNTIFTLVFDDGISSCKGFVQLLERNSNGY